MALRPGGEAMEPLNVERTLQPEAPSSGTDLRLRAFRATDAFALEAIRVSASLDRAPGEHLGGDIRRLVARCGGALVAASSAAPGSDAERQLLHSARSGLAEARYYLYLARRIGLLDLRRYRALAIRHDAALREVEAMLALAGPRSGRPPP